MLTCLPQARNLIMWLHCHSLQYQNNSAIIYFFLLSDEFKITKQLNWTTVTSIFLQAIQAAQGGSGERNIVLSPSQQCQSSGSDSHGRDVVILPNGGMESWLLQPLYWGPAVLAAKPSWKAFTLSKKIKRKDSSSSSSSSTAGWLTLKQD